MVIGKRGREGGRGQTNDFTNYKLEKRVGKPQNICERKQSGKGRSARKDVVWGKKQCGKGCSVGKDAVWERMQCG